MSLPVRACRALLLILCGSLALVEAAGCQSTDGVAKPTPIATAPQTVSMPLPQPIAPVAYVEPAAPAKAVKIDC
ncbi:MAG TPA: hypothetical protein VKB78_07565, partial [Pirellulales bacterium]|nr:hypothetical protein [Pirellulales bacterium]